MLKPRSCSTPTARRSSFYGYDDMGNITTGTFERIVQPINAMLEAHPDKPILVCGTSLHRTFYDYVTDLRNARYCYGCYLLAKTPGSFFSYGQNFQIARMFRERTGGAALYSYFELSLGGPIEPAVANGAGGWSRMYEGGQVFVAPAEGEEQQFQVGFDSVDDRRRSRGARYWWFGLLMRSFCCARSRRHRPTRSTQTSPIRRMSGWCSAIQVNTAITT
jgi:hypothetical protein